MNTNLIIDPVPAHVPPELVGEYPFVRGRYTTEIAGEIAQQVQDTEPREIWFAPNLFAEGGGWVFRRIRDMRAVALDTEHFSNKDFAPFAQMTGGSWNMIPAEQDPPVHSAYRMMINPLFTPRAIAALDESISCYASDYVAAFRDKGECEFMSDFAFRFPISVFMELMGLPKDRLDDFLEWETQLIHGSDFDEITKATCEVVGYLRNLIEERRDAPGDDFIGFGFKAKFQGRSLTDDELLGFFFNLFIGGLDSVTTHMGHFFRHLAEHPEHQAELRAHPDRIANAVDELLRAYGATTTMRTCIKDIEINGVLIKKGDRIAMSALLAGRDRDEFDDADVVRFDRRPRHMSLGYGPHLCIGMHLAKRELRIAMETMLAMLPEFRIKPGAEISTDLGGAAQTLSVPLVWDVR